MEALYTSCERVHTTPRGAVRYWVTNPSAPNGSPNQAPSGEESGIVLVFLHGMTANHDMFVPQIAGFADRYRTVAWDAPLHGASRPYADFSYAHAADDLRGILDAEGIDRAVLVGQSMGGFISQEFIARYPERVRAFVAIDSCPYDERYYSKSDLWWLRRMGWMMRLYPGRTLVNAIAKQSCETEAGRAAMRAMLSIYGKRELCDLTGVCYRAFADEHRDVDLPLPVQLIVGDRDRTGKVRFYNSEWHEHAAHPLAVIEGAGHGSNMDDPRAVNRVIERFLDSL
ncbi:alpha/beta fold hydrolase [Raoultibacter phocaeensis]|uniref:alpha/beta fold hydrolase n=1 Tax=Raoultibacter phocaeensis TaxID=2479841 RepID=UPI0015D6290B|nr:alpha/beta hydrolase [Raoultibacter phocaeensis]